MYNVGVECGLGVSGVRVWVRIGRTGTGSRLGLWLRVHNIWVWVWRKS